MAELEALTEHLGSMLNQLSDQERHKLEMQIGRKLRASQKSRITKQQNPDGSAYVPRKFRLRDKKNSSWRHTPFRNLKFHGRLQFHGSWRHTPFRNVPSDFTI